MKSSFLDPSASHSVQYSESPSLRSTPKTKRVASYTRRDNTRIQKQPRRESSSTSAHVLQPRPGHDSPTSYTSPPPETSAPDAGRLLRSAELEEDGLIDADWLEPPLSDYFDRQDEDEPKNESIIVLQRRGTKEVLSPQTWLDEWLLDPFRSFVRPMTPYMQRLMLQFFQLILPPAEFPCHPSDLARLGQMRLTSSATFYATLAVTAITEDFWKGRLASQVSLLKNGGQSSPYLPAFHVFKMQAIRELNRMLNDPFERTSDAVILTIMQLIPTEMMAGNSEELDVHFAGLQHIIQSRGGSHMLTPELQRSASVTELAYHYDPHTSTVFAPPELPPLPPDLLSHPLDAPIRRQGSTLLSLHTQGLVHPALIDIWSSLRTYIHFTQLSDAHPALITKPHDLYFRALAVILTHALVSLPFTASNASTHSALSEALRLATLLVPQYHTIPSDHPSPTIHILVKQLKTVIETSRIADLKDGAPAYAMLWVLFVGSACAEGMRERAWFVGVLAGKLAELRVEGWGEARTLLVDYFFLDRPLGGACGKAWRDADVVRRDVDAVRRDAGEVRSDADAVRRDAGEVRSDADAMRRDADAVRRDADAVRRGYSVSMS